MTTTNENLQSALYKHCSAMTPTIAIVGENASYTPVIGTPHLRTWLVPNETLPITLGPNGFLEYRGIFQINCYYPANRGWNPAKAKAGRICTHFHRGTRITYNSITVLIWRSYPGPAIIDNEWYVVPVAIDYSVFDNS